MNKILFNIFFLLILISCNESTIETPRDLSAFTDKTSYSGIAHIIVSIKNNTKSTIYFSHCNFKLAYYIEMKDSNSWIEYGSNGIICLAIYPSGRISLESLETIKDTIFFPYSGTYRLKYPYSFQENGGFTNSLITNEFNNHNPR
jgi:hypothetical protein